MKPFWIVAPLNVTEAAGRSGNRVGVQNGAAGLDFAVEPRGTARERERQRAQQTEVPAPAVDAGFGYVPDSKWTKSITHVFTTQGAAERYATELAEKNPKTLYGVFGCGNTYETTTPTVITKYFNESGELVVK